MNRNKQATTRNRIYAVMIIILLAIYALRFSRFETIVLPTSSRIEAKKQSIKQLDRERENQEKIRQIQLQQTNRVRNLVEDFWVINEKVPTNEIQLKIERMGRQAGVNLNKVGAPKVVDVNDYVKAIDITVSSTTSIKNLSEFLREIDNHQPALVWSNCVIRPNQTKEPTAVNISGKLRAYLIDEPVTSYIQERPAL